MNCRSTACPASAFSHRACSLVETTLLMTIAAALLVCWFEGAVHPAGSHPDSALASYLTSLELLIDSPPAGNAFLAAPDPAPVNGEGTSPVAPTCDRPLALLHTSILRAAPLPALPAPGPALLAKPIKRPLIATPIALPLAATVASESSSTHPRSFAEEAEQALPELVEVDTVMDGISSHCRRLALSEPMIRQLAADSSREVSASGSCSGDLIPTTGVSAPLSVLAQLVMAGPPEADLVAFLARTSASRKNAAQPSSSPAGPDERLQLACRVASSLLGAPGNPGCGPHTASSSPIWQDCQLPLLAPTGDRRHDPAAWQNSFVVPFKFGAHPLGWPTSRRWGSSCFSNP
jgi:hypothetical protein